MERIASTAKLSKRVVSFIEVNVDFSFFEDNVFLAPQINECFMTPTELSEMRYDS